MTKGGLRDRLKRLEKEAKGETLAIPQKDGTVRRFPQSAGAEALVSLIGGEDHPLAAAARNSPDPGWANSFYNAFPVDPETEDLSEP